ncbi:hypothetical protein B0H14DRAFT_3457192 [Mycena olivaceomarginata]|nr:hypothetical protein B0H14DRAFT_3457192 [Mycena olivaceomarginata]
MSWLAVLTPISPFPGRRGHVPHAGVCSLLDPPRLVPVASASSQALPCKGMKFASPLHLSAQTLPPALQATTSPTHTKCECPCTGMDTSIDLATMPVACLRTGSSPARLEFPFRLSSTHPSSTPASWTRGLAAYHAVQWWFLSSRALPANASSPNPPPCSERGHPLTAIHLHSPPSCHSTPAELARSHADKYVLRACIVEPAPIYPVPMGVLPALHISAPSSAYPLR